jgi:hypothetical protein
LKSNHARENGRSISMDFTEVFLELDVFERQRRGAAGQNAMRQ